MIDGYSYSIFRTPFGGVAVVWSAFGGKPRIYRVLLSVKGGPAPQRARALYPGSRPGSCAEIGVAARMISAFLHGEAVVFPLAIARLDLCPEFQRTVLLAEHGIPRGRISTYGLIARHIGKAGAARAAGSALANNPFPILIPCHRAVRSDWTLGGYQGGERMKRALLEMEGIAFDPAGRIENGEEAAWYL